MWKVRSNFGVLAFLTEEADFVGVPVTPFRGSWCNVLCYNGGIFYFSPDPLKHSLNIVKDDNKLLTAVHSDLKIWSYSCICGALGLVNKYVI